MKYKAVIFDLDGTVLDTLHDLTDSVNYSLNKFNLPPRTKREVRSFVGNGVKKLIDISAGENVGEDAKAEMLSLFRGYYSVHCADNTFPYEGIPEMLEELKSLGMKLAVVSNKPDHEVRTLIEKRFPDTFMLYCGEQQGVARKPSPEAVFRALDILGVKAEDAVYVGDSDVDILTAENAGTDGIIVTWGFRDRDFLVGKGAEKLADTVNGLTELLMM